MKNFLSRFGSMILFVLSGFDRLRLCGDSRLLNHALGVQSYLWQQKILFKDFPAHAQHLTTLLRQQTEALAQEQDVPLQYLNSPVLDKEATALQLAQARGGSQRLGCIALLSCVESCFGYKLRKNANGHIELRKEAGRCLHYYHYFQHERLGLCYVRIQSWFPFNVRIGLNGRRWLFRQLQQRGVAFQHDDNLLLKVEDAALAQTLLDEQTHTDWPTLLQELVQPIHPLWNYLHQSARTPYYWMAEQSEWATDVIFRSRADRDLWYDRWIRHGITTLSCHDVLHYLGKNVPATGYGNHSQEAKIDLRTRAEGRRLKFWYGTNSLKIYDKGRQAARTAAAASEPAAVRFENTMNDPSGYKVFRTKEGEDDNAPKSWQQLRKGIADLPRRAEIGQAANNRLIESMATVAETTPLGKLLEPLCRPAQDNQGRRVRALNPSAGPDGQLLRYLATGDFLLNGFRNRDLRAALHPPAADKQEQRRQSAALTRKLAILKAHGLIVKVQKTHRYHLSAAGKRITTALSAAYQADINELTQAG
jgi:hypothetical protein